MQFWVISKIPSKIQHGSKRQPSSTSFAPWEIFRKFQVAVVTLGALLLAGLFTAFGGKEGGGWGERVKCFFWILVVDFDCRCTLFTENSGNDGSTTPWKLSRKRNPFSATNMFFSLAWATDNSHSQWIETLHSYPNPRIFPMLVPRWSFSRGKKTCCTWMEVTHFYSLRLRSTWSL